MENYRLAAWAVHRSVAGGIKRPRKFFELGDQADQETQGDDG